MQVIWTSPDWFITLDYVRIECRETMMKQSTEKIRRISQIDLTIFWQKWKLFLVYKNNIEQNTDTKSHLDVDIFNHELYDLVVPD